jgi:hypothetical protein
MFITYGFIYRIKSFFSEIQLKVDKQVTKEEMYEHLFQTLSLLTSIEDMSYLFIEYQYCIKKLSKINRMLRLPRKRNMFDDTSFKNKDLLDKFDETINIVVTNILNKKTYTIYNPFNEKEDQYYDIQKKHKKFLLFSDSVFVGISKENYFLINDLDGNTVIKLKLDVNKENDFLFKNNVKDSIFEIRNEEGYVDLYNLSKNTEESITTISSDIYTEKKDDRGIQVLWVDEDADYELSILLTIGVAELTYNHFRKIDRRLNMMRYMTLKNLSR